MVEKVLNALRLLWSDPVAFLVRVSMMFRTIPATPIKKNINGVVFEIDISFDPAMKLMNYGMYERETVKIMKRFLPKDGVFVDVGANIGYMSTLALGFVGKAGHVHSFEPVPKYFKRLKSMADLNSESNITVNHCALGESAGSVSIAVTNLANIGWNTIVPGYMSPDTVKERFDVPSDRLDSYINHKGLKRIDLIKIDTEGCEFPVLKGMLNYFESTDNRPVIICEIAPPAYALMGYTISSLVEYMKKYGYRTFNVDKGMSEIDVTALTETTNVVFKVT